MMIINLINTMAADVLACQAQCHQISSRYDKLIMISSH